MPDQRATAPPRWKPSPALTAALARLLRQIAARQPGSQQKRGVDRPPEKPQEFGS
jgi:hypothetical protein